MNYWKLGCNLGRGMPDFYSLLKEKRIVICGGHPMEKGDWVLICQGHDVPARMCARSRRRRSHRLPDSRRTRAKAH